MARITRITESDLTRLVQRVIKEQTLLPNQGMGLKDESEKTISMEQWLRTLGVNGRASGEFWSYSRGFSGGLLTLKSSDGKTVKIKL